MRRSKRDGKCPYPVLKISQYPLPKTLIRKMTAACDRVLVIEEGQPFIEDQLTGIMFRVSLQGAQLLEELRVD